MAVFAILTGIEDEKEIKTRLENNNNNLRKALL
jgi:hypothetical protein